MTTNTQLAYFYFFLISFVHGKVHFNSALITGFSLQTFACQIEYEEGSSFSTVISRGFFEKNKRRATLKKEITMHLKKEQQGHSQTSRIAPENRKLKNRRVQWDVYISDHRWSCLVYSRRNKGQNI